MKSPDANHEQEAKFRVTDVDACQARLTALAQQGYHIEDTGKRVEHDAYLDTPAFDLVRQGWAVRLRRSGQEVTLGVKGLGAGRAAQVHDRLDVAVPFAPDADPTRYDAWPRPVTDLIAPLLPPDAQPTAPIAYIHQVRRRQRIRPPDAEHPAVEWSLDDVRVFAPEPNGGLRPTADFVELELERLPDGDAAHFAGVVEAVHADDRLQPLTDSKLERGLRSFPGEDAGVTPALDVAEACRRILYQQFIALVGLEYGVRRDDDPEYVHDMRVAIRRGRAAIHFFAAYFRKSGLRPQVKGLRRLGRALGAVRDLDVSLANLARFRKELPKDAAKDLKPLRRQMRAARKTARAALLRLLDSHQHRAWLMDFAQFCQTPGRGVRNSAPRDHEIPPRQVRHVFPGVILGCFAAVRAYENAFAQDDLPPLETFHSLRIACKYLRYSLEFAGHLLGEPGETLIAQLKLLQDHLGELNDASVEQERLAAWAAGLPESEALATRRSTLDATIAALAADFPPLYGRFIAAENRGVLAAALARL